MYEKFFGFSEKPFNTTPDSRFFFPSPKHTEALNSLIYAINERRGFVVITGEIGAGKTTVWRTMLNRLPLNTRIATITNTHLNCQELVSEILEELEVDYIPGTKQKLLAQLNNYLIKQLSQDVNVVLVIDEAQNLSSKVLEEVRMLSNLETEREKLIQIILMGQPQLKAKLGAHNLVQFRQRIAVSYHLYPLSLQETEEYIKHRIQVVRGGAQDIFEPACYELIYDYSGGTPRLVNIICDSALLSAYAYDLKAVTPAVIHEVAKEKELISSKEEQKKKIERKPAVKIFCCSGCQDYYQCIKKWERGIQGQEQICCKSCRSHEKCLANAQEDIQKSIVHG